MKKSFLFTALLLLEVTFSFAQVHKDTDSLTTQSASSGGFDITALAIGLIVGVGIGYVLGSRMAKK
ncbi:MAG: hypothetical protein U0Y10_10540 [Spirosomataceae bacterium]